MKPDYTAAAVPPDSEMASDPSTPTLGDLWRVGIAFHVSSVVATRLAREAAATRHASW